MNSETGDDYVSADDSYLEADQEIGKVFSEILDSPPYKQGLETVDTILKNSGYDMATHIGGEAYRDVAFEDEERISHLSLFIDEEPEEVWEEVDNAFFQRLYPGESFQPDEFSYMSFHLGSPFDFTSEVPVDFENLTIGYPAREEFLEQQVPLAIQYSSDF